MAAATQPWGGFDDDGDSFYDSDDLYDPSQDDDTDEADLESPECEIFEDWASQWDDDPSCYDGNYSEE